MTTKRKKKKNKGSMPVRTGHGGGKYMDKE
jgi:hypothetical protein